MSASGGASRHVPRKRFGQHFLRDASVIERIVGSIDARAGQSVVEIGPGEGVLTGPLLERLPQLHAVEIDRDLAARLRARFGDKLVLHEGDALKFDFGSLPAPLRIVGNLPYNISTPILFALAEHAARVIDQHFMLQKEVVDRMVAPAGGKDRGRLSVMLQYRYAMEPLFDVPPQAFEPPPKVDSSVVRMVPRPLVELTAHDETLLAKIVADAFSQRRKMLRNTLRAWYARLGGTGEAIVAPTARAEEVPVEAFVALANAAASAAAISPR